MDFLLAKTYTREIQTASDRPDILSLLRDCLETGAPSAWERFIALARPVVSSAVFATIRRWNRDRSLGEDLIQDAFVRLCAADFRVLRNFRGQDAASLHSYLRVIAASVASDRFRADPARTVSLDDAESTMPVADDRPQKTSSAACSSTASANASPAPRRAVNGSSGFTTAMA